MNLSFDLISDLHLTAEDKFVWEDKVTSLFCIISGNLSNDLSVIHKTLTHLSFLYKGIFYIDGSLEHDYLEDRDERIAQLTKICGSINNVAFLHSNVIVMNGVAVIGINGWYGNYEPMSSYDTEFLQSYRHEDLVYLHSTIRTLQLHSEVLDIIVVSNSTPNKTLYPTEHALTVDTNGPDVCLTADTEHKIKVWFFGTHTDIVNATQGGINYIANPMHKNETYWAKRVELVG